MNKKEKERIDRLIKNIKRLIKFPEKGYPRRTKEGYPSEIIYDRFAYERIINTYRRGLEHILEVYHKEK